MSSARSLVVTALVVAVGSLPAPRATAADLSVGDRAPAVSLRGPDGTALTLLDLLARGGPEGIVLAWFPKAFTPGCTAEIASLRDREKDIAALGVATFMVSLDPPDRNRAFGESAGAGFPVLSDPGGVTARAYGVLAPGGNVARRWTFTIDPSGVIRAIDRDVRPETHGADLVEALEALGRDHESP